MGATGAGLHRFQWKAMGCPCTLQLHADGASEARQLAATARSEITRLERKYSRYRPDSLLSRINASAGDTEGVNVDRETAALLDYAGTCHEQSGGRFDVTSGILRRAWDFRSGRPPEPGAIEALLPRVGWEKVRWEAPRVVLPLPGMELDLGGYVKEYAADRVASSLRDQGCRSGVVDLGGDLAVVGPHPNGAPWLVGIRDASQPERPAIRVPVFRGGVATSGDYERFMVVDGVRYGHVLDARSGWPVSGALASVTVLASRCLIAGSASTIALLHGDGASEWLDGLGLPHVRQDHDGRVTTHLESAVDGRRHGKAPRRPRRSGRAKKRGRVGRPGGART
jgi:thiamine biosynthesis lipoprotein